MRHLPIMKIFRERLRQAVDDRCAADGVTQAELAETLGLDRNRFRNYFTRATNMPLDQLRNIADGLELDLNWLLGRDETPEWPKEDQLSEISRKLDQALNNKN